MFSGMGRNSGGELAILVMTEVPPQPSRHGFFPTDTISCLRKNIFSYDLSGRKKVHGLKETQTCSIVIRSLAMGN